MLKRTHNCGEIRDSHIGETVTLNGWVNSFRDHGGVLFIDIRDFNGLTQVVFDPENGREMYDVANRLRLEDVFAATGRVVAREGGVNPKLPTGTVEVVATAVELLNKSEKPPVIPDDAEGVSEERRLQYRYLDLRAPKMQKILRARAQVMHIMRRELNEIGFCEIETPVLCKSTPEGARDFLVPSRLSAGMFYALPQSPQILKQILMMSGFDKYYQIVKCFRDEDLRADRQPEFTQLDVEMSFVDEDDVFAVYEKVMRAIWKEQLGVEIGPIDRLTYTDAMNRYGSDKPDRRFGVELVDVGDILGASEFRVFANALEKGGVVKAICVPGGASMSRKQTDQLGEWVKTFGAGGLPTVKVKDGGFETGISKFIADHAAALIERMGANDGDLICFAADHFKVVSRTLGELRLRLGRELELIEPGSWDFHWVTEFPLFDHDEETDTWAPAHHPFTSAPEGHYELMESDPGNAMSRAYDFVINGNECLSGSIRIHRPEDQQRVFKALGISDEEAEAKFGFMVNAMRYGCPPHGGFAVGLDRVVMLLCGTDNIRDVIAFPKTQTGADLMMEAPNVVDAAQLVELSLKTVEPSPSSP